MNIWNALRRPAEAKKAQLSTKPVRGWFGRTFIEPVEQLLRPISRFVRLVALFVIVLVVGVAGGTLCLLLLAIWNPAPNVAPSAKPYATVSPVTAAEKIENDPKPQPSQTDRIWVDGYTRKDGVRVKGHWRRK